MYNFVLISNFTLFSTEFKSCSMESALKTALINIKENKEDKKTIVVITHYVQSEQILIVCEDGKTYTLYKR